MESEGVDQLAHISLCPGMMDGLLACSAELSYFGEGLPKLFGPHKTTEWGSTAPRWVPNAIPPSIPVTDGLC